VAAVVLGWLFFIPFFGEGLTNLSLDLPPHLQSAAPPENVVIVYLDEMSREKLHQRSDSAWDRTLLARLLNRLKEDGSRVVIMDLVFDEPSLRPDDDVEFARAIRNHGKVVLSDRKLLPLLATNAAAIGTEAVFRDSDNVIRKLFSARVLEDGAEQVAFTWKAAEIEKAPATLAPEERFRFRWLKYYGPPDTIPGVTYFDALSNAPPGFFSGKLVLVGAPSEIGFADAGKDTFNSPYRSGKPLFSGVEVHATILANLVRGEWLRASLPLQAALLGVFGAGVGLVLVRFRPVVATVMALVCALAIFALACFSMWRLHFWFPWLTTVVVQIPAAWAWAVLFHWMQGQIERQFLEQSLSMYLSPKLVKKFSRDKDLSLLQPGAEKQKLTILFSDIASFTSISEGMDSDELAKMMNEYFEGAVGGCIHPTDGTVVKYIGDAIFAFWNAPEPQADHAVRACEAALRFRELSSQEVRGRKLATRIGLHTGVANVGNFGSATRVDYTAIGEDVNLASRMEGLNKYLGTMVLMTGAVKEEIGDRFATRYLGRFQLKGFERAVEVHELLARREEGGAAMSHEQEFQTAVRLFQERDVEASARAFEQLSAAAPHDGSTKFYLKHIEEMRAHPLPESWHGEVELKEK
jgi:adenylate cyclase